MQAWLSAIRQLSRPQSCIPSFFIALMARNTVVSRNPGAAKQHEEGFREPVDEVASLSDLIVGAGIAVAMWWLAEVQPC
jgi:hypothetical protein